MESNTNGETIENFSKLTYRQRFAVTEYGYLLSPEDAEVVGKMLGSFQEKDIPAFCKEHGKKVSKSQKKQPIEDEKTPRIIHTIISIIYIGIIVLNLPLILLSLAGGIEILNELIFPVVWVIGSIFISRILINKKNIRIAYIVLFSAPVIAWLVLVRDTW